MRSWFALASLMLLPLPSLAGPQDPWTVDPKTSAITFSVAQVGSIVSGRFPTWTGEIMLDPAALATARIDIKIDTRPVSANNRDVNSLMKGPNFLDVQRFPEARFVATSISGSGERYEARGKLTLRDVTRDVVLPFTLTIVDDPAQPGRQRGTAPRAAHHQTPRLRRGSERMGGHRTGRQRGDDRPQRRGRPHEMIGRRALLGAVPALLPPMAAHAQYSPWPDWLGAYAGTLRFYRSIPLEDIYPPPASPSVDRDDRSAFAVQFDIHAIDSVAELWLRIDGGPMQTAERGELLRFGTLVDGVALITSSEARPSPRSATLTVRRDLFSVEALFDPCRRQLLASSLHGALSGRRHRRHRLGVRRRRHARPHLAWVGGEEDLTFMAGGAPLQWRVMLFRTARLSRRS